MCQSSWELFCQTFMIKSFNTSQAVDMLDITGPSRCHTPPMRGAPMMPPGIIIMPGLTGNKKWDQSHSVAGMMWHVCTLCKWYESVRVTSSNSHRAYSATPTLRKGNVQRNCQALSGQVLCLSYESLNSVDSVLYISIYFEEIWFDGKRCKRCNRYCTRLFPFTRFLASWDSSLTCIKAPRWIKSKTNIYLRPFETTGWLEKTEKKTKKL